MSGNVSNQPEEHKKRRTRCRRKAKPLYERRGPKYFGHDMPITYNDLRDIAAALNDKSRRISNEVRKALPADLINAFEHMPTADQQIAICRLFVKMREQNRCRLENILEAIRNLNAA